MNIVKVIPYSLTGQWDSFALNPTLSTLSLLLINIILLPFSLTGVWLRYRLHTKISEENFMLACKSLLFFSGSGLLSSAMIY
jgi:hypothetical protein